MLRNVTSRAAAGRSRACNRLVQSQSQSCRIPETTHGGSVESRRAFATSDKKRALNAQQLKGAAKPAAKANANARSNVASLKDTTTASPTTESGGGGGGVGAVAFLLAATTGVGAAYYNGLLDEYLGDSQTPLSILKERALQEVEHAETSTKPDRAQAQDPKTATTAAAVATKTQTKTDTKTPAPSTKADEFIAEVAKEYVALSGKELDEFNEIIADVISEAAVEVEGVKEAVAAIAIEEKKTAEATAAAATAKVAAVAALKASAEAEAAAAVTTKHEAKKMKKKKKKEAAEAAAAAQAQAPPIAMMSTAIATSGLDESKIMAEIEDLRKQLNQRSDSALAEAHTELAKLGKLDLMGTDIDAMTQSQLKVRLVQMARDLEERTKWEAVRLQEFLSMKEKEVEDRYVLLIKKLRLQAEQLQEEKLVEQKKILTSQTEAAIQEQQTRSNAFLENSMSIQEKVHADDKLSFEQITKASMDAKYEELLGQELTKIKDDFATKMNQRVRQMEKLTKKLSDLEISLKTSQDFQVGSLEAHRITAAAIALMEKLESGDPAGAAVRALEAVASDNAVVSSAVQLLPPSVSLSGVSTLQELQASFDETIYPQCRKAANVPPGSKGLEGQLLGSIFSILRLPPGPQEAAPELEKDDSEFVLARMKRYVQLGELEQAVRESKKLEGQVAFTARDWEAQARDRVSVEKALKVIRMECALANENLTQATAA